MLFLSFWTNLCLIRVWLCYVIGLCSFNVWSVSIDKDCLEVVKHILIIQHDSSVLDENENTFVFLDESFLEIETNIWYAPCTRKSNFMSGTFFFCFFFLPLFSHSSFLGKTEFYQELLFFGLFSLFSDVVSRDFECFYCCNITENRQSNWMFGSQTMEIKIMKNGFRLLWAFKQNCFFFYN